MKKSLIALAVAGVATVALSANAFAGGDVAASAPEAPASAGGFYVLGGLGWGNQSIKSESGVADSGVPITLKTNKKSGFAQTIAAGYKFSGMTGDMSFLNYLGLELGFKNFADASWDINTGGVKTSVDLDNKVYLFDLQAVATIPVQDKFYVQGLAGGAYAHDDIDASAAGHSATATKNWTWAFELGARAGYHVTSNVDVQVAYAHIFKRKSFGDDSYLPSLNMVTANVVYNFGDNFLG